MMRIVSPAAFEVIAATLPLGVGYEAEPNERGERLIWFEEIWVKKLVAMHEGVPAP